MTEKAEALEPWTTIGLAHAMSFVEMRLRADLPLPEISVGIDDTFSEVKWDRDTVPPSTKHVVVSAGGHRFIAGLSRGVEAACAHAADQLQDDVMDDLNRPWPEVTIGSRTGVLQAALEPLGIAHWRLGEQPVCAIGHLRPLLDRLEIPWR